MPLSPERLLLGQAEKARAADVSLLDATVVLDVVRSREKSIDIRDMIVDIEIERTMSGASTVTFTIFDPERKVLRAPALKYALEIGMDNWGFRLYSIKKAGDILTLVFEDKAIAYLRQKKNILVTASRSKLTRVQFCMHLISRVKAEKLRVIAPEAQVIQRIKDLSNADKGKLVESREPGVASGADLTVKGVKATKNQINVGETIMRVGAETGARNKVIISGVMAGIGESLLTDTKLKTTSRPGIDGSTVSIPLDSGSAGVFRQIPAMDWPPYGSSVEVQAEAYFKGHGSNVGAIKADEDNPDFMAWEICAAVQRPRADLRKSTYEPWKQEAIKFVDSFSPGQAGSDVTTRGSYTYSTRNDSGDIEDFWETIKRLMEEVQWAVFAQQGAIYLMREAYLSASRPIMTVSPESDGIEDIDLDWNVNKEEAKATVTCYAERWEAPAGSAVKLKDMGDGPDSVRWLVDSIRRKYDDPLTTIELRSAQHSLPEPAPGLITVSLSDQGPDISGSDVNGLPDAIAAAYKEAQKIDAKQYPYSWGGGHEKAGTPSRHSASSTGGSIVLGYDCSGSVAAVLAAAQAYAKGAAKSKLPAKGDSVPASGSFGQYGTPGEGKYMTWWYNGGHIFLEFKRPKNASEDDTGTTVDKAEHWGTGRWGKSWSGAGFNSELHPHDGYQAAHIAGM